MNHANVHRGVHELSERSTAAYEGARTKVQRFINAARVEEIVFTRGTTESINLVASSFGRQRLAPGDEVLITWMEHHSNIVPWQLICERRARSSSSRRSRTTGELDRAAFSRCSTRARRSWRWHYVSNALGTVNPIAELVAEGPSRGRRRARRRRAGRAAPTRRRAGARLRLPTRFRATRCSGPRASACCTASMRCSTAMPPYQGGGDMILTVQLRAQHLQRAAVQVRGRDAEHHGRRRARRRGRLSRAHRFRRASRATSTRCSSTQRNACSRRSRALA